MALLAIIHIPDHTAVADIDPVLVANYIEADIGQTGGRVIGIFDFPARAELKCSGNCVTGKSGAWTRDPRGFMKCAVCGSRNRKLRRWLIGHLFDLLGANLINDHAPAAFRTPDGYGHPR